MQLPYGVHTILRTSISLKPYKSLPLGCAQRTGRQTIVIYWIVTKLLVLMHRGSTCVWATGFLYLPKCSCFQVLKRVPHMGSNHFAQQYVCTDVLPLLLPSHCLSTECITTVCHIISLSVVLQTQLLVPQLSVSMACLASCYYVFCFFFWVHIHIISVYVYPCIHAKCIIKKNHLVFPYLINCSSRMQMSRSQLSLYSSFHWCMWFDSSFLNSLPQHGLLWTE